MVTNEIGGGEAAILVVVMVKVMVVMAQSLRPRGFFATEATIRGDCAAWRKLVDGRRSQVENTSEERTKARGASENHAHKMLEDCTDGRIDDGIGIVL